MRSLYCTLYALDEEEDGKGMKRAHSFIGACGPPSCVMAHASCPSSRAARPLSNATAHGGRRPGPRRAVFFFDFVFGPSEKKSLLGVMFVLQGGELPHTRSPGAARRSTPPLTLSRPSHVPQSGVQQRGSLSDSGPVLRRSTVCFVVA